MKLQYFMALIVVTWLSCQSAGFCYGGNGADDMKRFVEHGIRRLVSENNKHEGFSILMKCADSATVEGLARLQQSIDSLDPTTKYYIYQLYEYHQASRFAIGQEALLVGIGDTVVSRLAFSELRDVQPVNQKAIVGRMLRWLEFSVITEQMHRDAFSVFRIFGKNAYEAIPLLEKTLKSDSHGDAIAIEAARAYLAISGLKGTLSLIERENETLAKDFLPAINQYVLSSNTRDSVATELIPRIVDFVLNSFSGNDTRRTQASIQWGYGILFAAEEYSKLMTVGNTKRGPVDSFAISLQNYILQHAADTALISAAQQKLRMIEARSTE